MIKLVHLLSYSVVTRCGIEKYSSKGKEARDLKPQVRVTVYRENVTCKRCKKLAGIGE